MAFVNENYCNLKESYLFADIAHKVSAYAEAHPDKKIIRLGIGDVTLPLAPCVVEAMEKAVREMGSKECEANGNKYIVVRSLDEFIKVVDI